MAPNGSAPARQSLNQHWPGIHHFSGVPLLHEPILTERSIGTSLVLTGILILSGKQKKGVGSLLLYPLYLPPRKGKAQVAKLVDALSSGGSAARCAGSNPVLGTSKCRTLIRREFDEGFLFLRDQREHIAIQSGTSILMIKLFLTKPFFLLL